MRNSVVRGELLFREVSREHTTQVRQVSVRIPEIQKGNLEDEVEEQVPSGKQPMP